MLKSRTWSTTVSAEMQSVEAQDDDAHDLAHLLSDDEDDAGGRTRAALLTESVLTILSRMAPSNGDECVACSHFDCKCE